MEVEYPPDMDDVPRSGDRRQYLSASKVSEQSFVVAAGRCAPVLVRLEDAWILFMVVAGRPLSFETVRPMYGLPQGRVGKGRVENRRTSMLFAWYILRCRYGWVFVEREEACFLLLSCRPSRGKPLAVERGILDKRKPIVIRARFVQFGSVVDSTRCVGHRCALP